MNTNTVLTPPSFAVGLTPADILAWGRDEDGSDAIEAMLDRYGEDTAVALLLARYNRAHLVALLVGQVTPEGDEQAAFLAAVEAGQPVSLLSVGHEDLAAQGFAPTVQKAAGGWRWQCGSYGGGQPDLTAALQQYAQTVNRLAG